MNAILTSTLRKGDARSHPECGQYAGLRLSGESLQPESEALSSTACRVDGVWEAQSRQRRHFQDARIVRQERRLAEEVASRQHPEVPTVFPLRTKKNSAPPRPFLQE
jgi:hypothetical protein